MKRSYSGPMSEGNEKPRRFQFNLRRSFYGWTSAAFSFVAGACLVCWIVTITSARAEVPAVRFRGVFVSAANGSITLCSDVGETIKAMDEWASYAAKVNEPSDHRKLDLPGFRYRIHFYTPSNSDWVLEMSILIPFVAMGLLAAIGLYRYRAVYRQPTSKNVASDRPATQPPEH